MLDAIENSSHLAPLRNQKAWCVWKFEPPVNGGTKPTKVSYYANAPTRRASTTQLKNWDSFEAALTVMRSGGFDGIGYLLAGGLVAALDIDNCRDPATGAIIPWAQKLIDAPRTYVEITPSGTGLRVIGYCRPKSGPVHCKIPEPGGAAHLEIYRKTARYITVSGNPLPGYDVELHDIDALIDRHKRVDLPPPSTQPAKRPRKPLPPDLLSDRVQPADRGTIGRSLFRGREP
jgi:primase-polymerase (primpol)-like protein